MNKILSIALLLMLGFTSLLLLATKENATALPPDSTTGKAAIGGSFTLTDQNGNEVNDVQFRGKDMLVFFGFTNCPMICPTTMATVSSAMATLGEKADQIVPVFISVDPANDTPERIKEFLTNFDSRIVGLTGSEDAIKDAAAEYKAYFSETDGMMDHSTLIYWMDANGQYLTHFSYDVTPDELAAKLAKGLK